jgi:predicted nuclease of predicted toxin-antitoxin system
MIKLLIDVNVDHDILRGLRLRLPALDALIAQEVGLSETPDPELLAWAAEQGRLLLTHDLKAALPH